MAPSWRSGRRDLPAKDPGGPPAKFLPPDIYAMFRPRPPLEFKPPMVKRKMPPYTGVAALTSSFETTTPPERVVTETPKERQTKRRAAKEAAQKTELEKRIEQYDPNKGEHLTENAYKTLFVGRLAYEVTEKKLRREFERFGVIKAVKMIMDRTRTNPRGFAFVEFESERAMTEAFKRADGMKIAGRRIVVDVERGRTVRNWKPRRLGGGLGGTRNGSKRENVVHSGRAGSVPSSSSSGGGSMSSSSSYQRRPPANSYRSSSGYDNRRQSSYGGDRNSFYSSGGGGYGGGRRDSYRDRGRDRDRDRDRGRRDRSRSRDRGSRRW